MNAMASISPWKCRCIGWNGAEESKMRQTRKAYRHMRHDSRPYASSSLFTTCIFPFCLFNIIHIFLVALSTPQRRRHATVVFITVLWPYIIYICIYFQWNIVSSHFVVDQNARTFRVCRKKLFQQKTFNFKMAYYSFIFTWNIWNKTFIIFFNCSKVYKTYINILMMILKYL